MSRANYLLPKWYGESDHDATDFAKESSDRLGGDEGDMMYFVIATEILHRGNGNLDPFVKAMDWQRIRRGYKVLEAQFGVTNRERNQLAFMAYKYNDHEIAQMQFASIGDNWATSVWKERSFYDRIRDWSNHATQWP